MQKIAVVAIIGLFAVSCVAPKKFNSMKAEALRLENLLSDAEAQNNALKIQNDKLLQEKNQLIKDTVRLYGDYTYVQKKLSASPVSAVVGGWIG